MSVPKSTQDSTTAHEECVVEPSIPAAHWEYLRKRHGRIDLEPLPSIDPNDPYNWPAWKKHVNLFLVSFQSMVTVLNAAAILPAVLLLEKDLKVSLTEVTYLIGVQILFLGIAPVLWKPIAQRYGRRPIFLISALGGVVFNIACACTRSFGAQIVTRIFVSIFLAPSLALGGAVVAETFFVHERASKMGIWTLAFTCGPALGPFIAGFIVQHTGTWTWVYWSLAIISFASLLANIFFAPETLYNRTLHDDEEMATKSNGVKAQYLTIKRINSAKFTLEEFYRPYLMLKHLSVVVPSIAYAMTFNIASPALSIAIPSAYAIKFGLNAQQTGLQFLALLIGAIMGELSSSRLSDIVMARKAKKAHGARLPEYRLWASYVGFACVIAGVIEWGVTLQNAPTGPWTVIPSIGLGIASFGNQVVATALVTYAIDCFPADAASVGAAINQVRQLWAFLGPFWFTPMYENVGYAVAAAIMASMIFGSALIPTLLLHSRQNRRRASSSL